ncbi:MAG TPA: glycine--tRNA ligase [Candidatus Saccharimonadales bacterium]|nr:glycine--tRNA ligase [Candidatus Saccharimonadales bacterium]
MSDNLTLNKSGLMEKVVSLAKRRGFIFPGSEIYGGLANTYDYGPAGAELLRNIKNLWWENFVQKRSDIVGLDASIISHHKIWEASGHVAGFADAMVDCKKCKARYRADHIIEDYLEMLALSEDSVMTDAEKMLASADLSPELVSKTLQTGKVEGLSIKVMSNIVQRAKIKCANCGKSDWTNVRKFNQLFPVQLGIVEGEGGHAYLRGETAQGMFINFRNIIDSTRVQLPFGVAQQGKGFRNEITPGNSVFRTIEFDMGEIEYFFDPEVNNWEELFETWKKEIWEFVTKKLGVDAESLRWRPHTDEERSFYSKRTEDLEYKFPFGFKELWGLAYRTDYDLSQHINLSKKDLVIVDPQTGKKLIPHVIEPAVGINRLLLMILADGYAEEENRTVLKINPRLAPYKAAVFPLLANKPELVKKATEVFNGLKDNFMVAFDDRGNIGKRYLAQDEIGTPWCITVDFQTLEDDTLTVRDRDTTKQERLSVKDLTSYFQKKLA